MAERQQKYLIDHARFVRERQGIHDLIIPRPGPNCKIRSRDPPTCPSIYIKLVFGVLNCP